MPRRPPDDDDVPRWEPPAPSTDVPRWEPPVAEDIPRWEPPAPPRRATRRRAAPPAPPPPTPHVATLARPFHGWGAHPWLVVWALVFAIPGAALGLRIVDESEHAALVGVLIWLYVAVFVAALVMGVRRSGPRSALRMGLGLGGALAVAGLLVWSVTQVTFGRAPCPARAGSDLGVATAASALEAWAAGRAGDAGWQHGQPDAAWTERTGTARLLDYHVVDSGCWERAAPVDGTRTWHEFRVNVQPGEGPPLSKIVVVHTTAAEGWKITAIEGPLP
jgi:hypothetical protein